MIIYISSVQFSSVSQLCPTLCDPMNCSMPGLPVHHQLLEFTQTHVHWVSDAIQPSHPLSSPSPPAPNPSQLQSLFQWVNSSILRHNLHTAKFIHYKSIIQWFLSKFRVVRPSLQSKLRTRPSPQNDAVMMPMHLSLYRCTFSGTCLG